MAREQPDLTLSAQIEAILKRKGQVERAQQVADRASQVPVREPRAVIDPPPLQVAAADNTGALDSDFLKFSEAVYLIGQAAKRFIDQPQSAPVRSRDPAPAAPRQAT